MCCLFVFVFLKRPHENSVKNREKRLLGARNDIGGDGGFRSHVKLGGEGAKEVSHERTRNVK